MPNPRRPADNSTIINGDILGRRNATMIIATRKTNRDGRNSSIIPIVV
jgi:hypothetical protein